MAAQNYVLTASLTAK